VLSSMLLIFRWLVTAGLCEEVASPSSVLSVVDTSFGCAACWWRHIQLAEPPGLVLLFR
jgi:hypothetical protein